MATTTARQPAPGRAVVVRPAPRRPVRRRPVRRAPIRRVRRRPALRRRVPIGHRQVPGWVIVAGSLAVLLLAGRGVAEVVPAPAAPPAAAPYTDATTGCVLPDPTSRGCLTGATAHALNEIDRVFGGYRQGPKIRSAGCWDKHAWNPTSDHPKGRACDFFFGRAGVFPAGAELDAGWELANWLRANAGPLRVRYVIWQGRIWTVGRPDEPGEWGRRYSGGGVYDAESATGGHYDHVHVSFQQ